MAERVEAAGAEIRLGHSAVALNRDGWHVRTVELEGPGGRQAAAGSQVIASMPLGELILALAPPAPEDVQASARALRHRAFVCVALILRRRDVFTDNWIYVHSPEVRVARIQNFKNWSPAMVPDPETTCLGLEYFCDVGDAIWSLPDSELVALGARELEHLGLARRTDVSDGVATRQTHAYPVYDSSYAAHVRRLRDYLRGFANLQTIGRNGLHRYDNQDHAMLTALLAARNALGERHDVWAVNSAAEHHESAT
jgi:protoporphyrinogen oxidase